MAKVKNVDYRQHGQRVSYIAFPHKHDPVEIAPGEEAEVDDAFAKVLERQHNAESDHKPFEISYAPAGKGGK